MPPPAAPPATAPAPAAKPTSASAIIERERSRWVRAEWSDLPGWVDDGVLAALPALERSCEQPAPAFATWCRALRDQAPRSDAELRALLEQRLQPYRVENPQGEAEGLVTGYYEPMLEARRVRDATFRHPLHAPPADLVPGRPYWTREQIETRREAQVALRDKVIAYLADPLDVLVLQIQGSGRLQLTEADGRRQLVRLAYAGHNGQPYRSVGRWLIERGELPEGGASWPAIQDWARARPAQVRELLWANPRVVFFREEPLPDPALGPRGAMGVALTPERSIAVDPASVPYGTPAWIATTEPLSASPLRRLVAAQDTGSAIRGAVRADYFWGWGETAQQQAGRMKQPLRLWALWPRDG